MKKKESVDIKKYGKISPHHHYRSNELFDDAVKRYLNHPKDETPEQRAARINRFRCGY